jgi:hypothetical protein
MKSLILGKVSKYTFINLSASDLSKLSCIAMPAIEDPYKQKLYMFPYSLDYTIILI